MYLCVYSIWTDRQHDMSGSAWTEFAFRILAITLTMVYIFFLETVSCIRSEEGTGTTCFDTHRHLFPHLHRLATSFHESDGKMDELGDRYPFDANQNLFARNDDEFNGKSHHFHGQTISADDAVPYGPKSAHSFSVS